MSRSRHARVACPSSMCSVCARDSRVRRPGIGSAQASRGGAGTLLAELCPPRNTRAREACVRVVYAWGCGTPRPRFASRFAGTTSLPPEPQGGACVGMCQRTALGAVALCGHDPLGGAQLDALGIHALECAYGGARYGGAFCERRQDWMRAFPARHALEATLTVPLLGCHIPGTVTEPLQTRVSAGQRRAAWQKSSILRVPLVAKNSCKAPTCNCNASLRQGGASTPGHKAHGCTNTPRRHPCPSTPTPSPRPASATSAW